jgi:cobaltochelatase CobN
MARAETYGDIARLEQLLDEHANVAALDPAKLPAIRQQIWTLMQAAKLDHDLGLEERPHEAEFDDFILHVDGWLCEIKDVQIRDGLHVLGAAPAGDVRVDLVLAILRARQMWGGEQSLPGLREALGLPDDAPKARVDEVEALAHALVAGMEAAGWEPDAAAHRRRRARRERHTRAGKRSDSRGGRAGAPVRGGGGRAAARRDRAGDPARPARPRRRLHPRRPVRLAAAGAGQRAPDRPQLLLRRPQGRPVAAGLGDRAGDGGVAGRALPARPRRRLPAVGRLSVWGTSAMRTSGDDIAEVFALLGVRRSGTRRPAAWPALR